MDLTTRAYDELDSRAELGIKTEPRRYGTIGSILLIEDQKELNNSLAIRLRKAGFEVASAYDGLTGLIKFRYTEPDLVILDLGLPRLHGTKFLHQLRTEPGLLGAPIVVVTGDPDPTLERRVTKLGVNKVFRKPVRQREIVEYVTDLLDGFHELG